MKKILYSQHKWTIEIKITRSVFMLNIKNKRNKILCLVISKKQFIYALEVTVLVFIPLLTELFNTRI